MPPIEKEGSGIGVAGHIALDEAVDGYDDQVTMLPFHGLKNAVNLVLRSPDLATKAINGVVTGQRYQAVQRLGVADATLYQIGDIPRAKGVVSKVVQAAGVVGAPGDDAVQITGGGRLIMRPSENSLAA